MATQAAMRDVLREAGLTVPARGLLSGELVSKYEELTGDYDGGVTAADFPDELEELGPAPSVADAGDSTRDADGPGPAPPGAGNERRPRRVRQSRPKLSERLKTVQGRPRPGSRGKAKPKRPRVPVDRLIGRGYEIAGRVMMQISPPIGRCIQWQAPTAGVILEARIRDTFVDRALQPLARAEDAGEAVFALAGPPVIIGMLQAAQGLPEEQAAIRVAFLMPVLREALAVNVRIAGEQMEAIAAKQTAEGPIYERVDRLIAMMFAPPSPPGPDADDQAAAAAQHMAGV